MSETWVSLWGDWSESTSVAADLLEEAGIKFRICLTRDYDGIPMLSVPYGDIWGLDEIRLFVKNHA